MIAYKRPGLFPEFWGVGFKKFYIKINIKTVTKTKTQQL